MPRKTIGRAKGEAVPNLETIENVLHAVVRKAAPDLRVRRKWENDWYAGTDLVCCIGAFTHHVGVEFWRGGSLGDPAHLLEGTGKNLRHVKVRTEKEAKSRAFAALVREAARVDGVEARRAR
ncbi:MAG: DUF1801 domain-containing protein [Thermoplasmata archaeon]